MTQRIRAERPETQVIILTSVSEQDCVGCARGARGRNRLCRKERRGHGAGAETTPPFGRDRPGPPLNSRTAARLMQEMHSPTTQLQLTDRERQVLREIAIGRTNKRDCPFVAHCAHDSQVTCQGYPRQARRREPDASRNASRPLRIGVTRRGSGRLSTKPFESIGGAEARVLILERQILVRGTHGSRAFADGGRHASSTQLDRQIANREQSRPTRLERERATQPALAQLASRSASVSSRSVRTKPCSGPPLRITSATQSSHRPPETSACLTRRVSSADDHGRCVCTDRRFERRRRRSTRHCLRNPPDDRRVVCERRTP